MSAIQLGHLNGLQNVIAPVQVATYPVYSKALSDSDATVKYLLEKKKGFFSHKFHTLKIKTLVRSRSQLLIESNLLINTFS